MVFDCPLTKNKTFYSKIGSSHYTCVITMVNQKYFSMKFTPNNERRSSNGTVRIKITDH